jgi:siderophore synthetase component
MNNEEIQKMNDKIKALEQKKKALEYKVSNEDRRKKTRRLIQKGALLEKYLENEGATLKDTENLLTVLAKFKNKNKDYVNQQIKNLSD